MHTRNTITLRNRVYSRLRQHGHFGESFSSLIERILNQLEGEEKKVE
jgi:predicted CopG family antitoxin